MNIFKKIFLLTIINFSVLSFAEEGWSGGGPNGPSEGVGPGGIPDNPDDCVPIPNVDIPDGWNSTQNCEGLGPGTHVPINNYIPLLALAAITIGGITFYRNQKQII